MKMWNRGFVWSSVGLVLERQTCDVDLLACVGRCWLPTGVHPWGHVSLNSGVPKKMSFSIS